MTTSNEGETPEERAERCILVRRVLNAPRELVFEAWTDPRHVTHWWGPRGFRTVTTQMDPRPGGTWHFTMIGPDGVEYRNKVVYVEVTPAERLVYDHVSGPHFRMEATFAALPGGRTELTACMVFQTKALRDHIAAEFGAEEGLQHTAERLGEVLAARGIVPPTDREMIIRRIIRAPREIVFKAFTDPVHIGNWWGPRGFRTTTYSMDVRPGGEWRYMMHGPDGRDYPNWIRYREVTAPERLVYDHGGERETPDFQTTIYFLEAADATEVVLRAVFPSAEACKETLRYGAVEGGLQTLERLAGHVEPASPEASVAFSITRTFRAPLQDVFRAWTQEDQLAQWFGPKGSRITASRLDFRPGGTYHYRMTFPGGAEMWGLWTFTEIVPPLRLVYISAFSDAEGGLGRHPFAPEWPRQFRATVTFAAVPDGTAITLHWFPHEESTPEERGVFEAGHDSMRGGWTGTFDQLEDYLKPR